MAKKKKHLTEGVSFVGAPGTLAQMRAVSYFIGKKGNLGKGAREIVRRGMESFLASLNGAERRRFNEILASVKMAQGLSGELEEESSLPKQLLQEE